MSEESSNTEHLEHDKHIRQTLSETQKCRMLTEMHTALIGKPFDNPPKLGALAKVDAHEKILYGTNNWNGLIKDNRRNTRILWMGGGFGVALQAFWAWLLATKQK